MLHKAVTHEGVIVAKIPYLFRRKNIFYFRARIPLKYQKSFKAKEVVRSLKTESRAEASFQALQLAAHFKAVLHDLKSGKTSPKRFGGLDALSSIEGVADIANNQASELHHGAISSIPTDIYVRQVNAPLLSVVIDDFLSRYDQNNQATLTKLTATLPVFLELISDKPINQILQADINAYFDNVQKLPVRRNAKKYSGMSLKEIMVANTGKCISEGTFGSTYRACVSIFTNWAIINYKDQGFPSLSTHGAVYHGLRADGINKQRAMKQEELQTLFEHDKMRLYATDSSKAHYYWLPLIGLYTGCRINEATQLNPFTDIKLDKETGIYYFHFTDESETAEGVNKSIKTNSSRRIVPIHSRLLRLGFLEYVERAKRNGKKIIFPAWAPRNGKTSANASKWFKRYIESIGLRDETEGARLSGFHSLRHTFITHGMKHKIQGVFEITGHEIDVVDGIGKISTVANGYWTREITDNILEKQKTIEQFDFGIKFYKPACF